MLETLWGYFAHWTDHPVGQIHLFTAYTALVLGPVIFLHRKGTLSHRVLGYVFVTSMLAVNLSALTRYGLTGGPNFFHLAALLSLATLVAGVAFGWRARLRKSPRAFITHGIFMTWSYFGLVMAFVAEAVTRRFPFLLHGEGAWTRFFIFLAALIFITAWWTAGILRRHVIRRAT